MATYGAQDWTLTIAYISILKVSEQKIIGKIYGSVKEGDIWRMRKNYEEADSVLEGYYTVRFMKSRRTDSLGHVERMG